MSRNLFGISPRRLVLIAACLILCVCPGRSGARAENRTYDGSDNNLDPVRTTWGAAGTQLARMSPAAYADGIFSPSGAGRPGPRLISNTVIAQTIMVPNTHEMTDWVFQWGQFIDHDLDLTVLASPAESFNIPIPAGDPIFDPMNTGTQVMAFQRSKYDPATGIGAGNPREQINEVTSYIDASMVYGSDAVRATTLRTLSGDGRLKTSAGNLLPLNTFGLPNGTGGPGDPTQFYVAGDVRVNEQVGLASVHTLMMREHNRLADEIASANPGWTDDEIYQRARKLVGAEIQVITYREFLPALLGGFAPGVNSVYDPNVNATVLTEFSTALFRVGHTMLSPQLMRMQNDGTPAPGGHMALRDAFFLPQSLAGSGELECFLKGLASDRQQEVDMHVIDDVRNFLFGEPIPGGFDLPALNIQRGRDHGLPDYNTIRDAFDLPAATSFADISSDLAIQAGLQSLYGDVNDVDVWVGAIAEDHLPGAAVGPLIAAGLVEQFTRARDGDRFWYRNDPDLSPDDIAWLESVQLSDLILWNTTITNIQGDVFFMAVPEPSAIGLAMLGAAVGALARRRLRPSRVVPRSPRR
jgi:hypothetical protein